MKNIIPKAEGMAPEIHVLKAKNELLDILKPILDGWDGMSDVQTMVMEAIQAATILKNLPSDIRNKVIGVALASIGSDVAMDMLIIYPEEEEAL